MVQTSLIIGEKVPKAYQVLEQVWLKVLQDLRENEELPDQVHREVCTTHGLNILAGKTFDAED